jgi:predicted lipoprotein with Yx(FWY)xxD motif
MHEKMFRKSSLIAAVLGAAALAACGGGAGGSNAASYGGLPPPSPPQNANLPVKQTVAGAPAFVSASNHQTLYFLDVDTPTGGKCTGGCLTTWFVNAPNAAASSAGSFTIVTRSDGTGMQWDYKNHPLYTYAGDSGPDQANGEGIPFAGGHWHVARPA